VASPSGSGRRDENGQWRSKLSIIVLLVIILGMELNGMGFVASGLSKSSSADPTSNISKDGAMVSSLLISKFITFINPDASSPSPPPGVKETSANPEATSRPADPVEKGGRPLQGEEVGSTKRLYDNVRGDSRTSRCFGKCPQNWRQNLHINRNR